MDILENVSAPAGTAARRNSLTAEERSLRGRIGALTLHSRGGTTTTAARTALARKFEREVDPEGILDPAVRARRADQARRLFMTRMAFASAKARRRQTPRQ